MGDLISRQELLKLFVNLRDEHETTSISYNALYELILKQPTAYDVEKVVAELEYEAKLQEYLRQNAHNRCNIEQAHIHRYAEQCYRNKAIEIVRKGGAE